MFNMNEYLYREQKNCDLQREAEHERRVKEAQADNRARRASRRKIDARPNTFAAKLARVWSQF